MYDINSSIMGVSGVSADQLDEAMKSIRPDHLLKKAIPAMLEMEKKYKINVLFIAAHAATESAWGHSLIARTKNNLFGFRAYDSNPSKASRYGSVSDSVKFYAGFLHKHYLTEGGKYFNGRTPSGIMVRYASAGDKAAKTIVNIMNDFADAIGLTSQKKPDGFPQKKDQKEPENQKQRVQPTHTIVKGDTFWDLENHYNLDHGTLEQLNPDYDPRKLQIGTKISLPNWIKQAEPENDQKKSNEQNQPKDC